MARIGVFICHCGENIARTVDVEKLAEKAGFLPHVRFSTAYKYLCSQPGQEIIVNAVRDHGLDCIVAASCSPRMHLNTFKAAAFRAGLNPFMVEMANIREQCSWVHNDPVLTTDKALDLISMAVSKVALSEPLEPFRVPVTKRALVLGGGIAGIQAALDLAEAGLEVLLVEKSPSIGGRMAQLSETFPTMDCSQCILTPRMVEAASNPGIRLLTGSELLSLKGFVGNFKASIRVRTRSVAADLCTRCGLCVEKCLSKNIASEFDQGLKSRNAIYIPFPQAIPNVPVLDRENCLYFKSEGAKCGVCARVCPTNAIDFSMQDEIIEVEIGALVIATGFDIADSGVAPEYGGGNLRDVITGLQFERMASASGPTSGKILRPSDGTEPKTVVFISCVGSRDRAKGIEQCSKICCMYLAKHAQLFRHKVPNGTAKVFYMDIRAVGKGYDEFVRKGIEKDEIQYIRGRVSRLYEENGKIVVMGADTIAAEPVRVEADLVVLGTAVIPRNDFKDTASKIGVNLGVEGFFSELHPKLRPVETSRAGVFLAGACQAPKDIPETVAQASAAASKVIGLLSRDFIERDPLIAHVIETHCSGCGGCVELCPFKAIELQAATDSSGKVKNIAWIKEAECQGCGACAATCRSGAIELKGFSDSQILAQIQALGNH